MTIAFSLKSNMWTTEYSFESTCYGTTDSRMLSFQDVPNSTKLWLHDQTGDRNRFYLQDFVSRISVVSNEDPSATKAYEAVSLETMYNSWSMNVATHEQQGSSDEFNEKENDQYASIPKDIRFTGANLTYLGTASGSSLTSLSLARGQILLNNMSGRFASGVLCYRNQAQGTAFIDANATDGAIAYIERSGMRRAIIGANEQIFDVALQCESLNTQTKIITIGNVPTTIFSFPEDSEPEGSAFYTEDTNVEIWVASPGSGESMKGDYIVVDLETAPGPDKFELYAINVDQHKVNLDHRLGQNN